LKDCAVRPVTAAGRDYSFEIYKKEGKGQMTAKHATYVLSADTANDMDSWMKAITHAANAASGDYKSFGQPIAAVVRRENQGNPIPSVVETAVKYIEAKGLASEGIYRLSGNSSEVTYLQTRYDRGEMTADELSAVKDPNVVAAVVKLYFRELPEPLCTFDRYNEFTGIAAKANDPTKAAEMHIRIAELRAAVNYLPAANRATLQFVIKHLCTVASQSAKNQMPIENLAAVFGPNLLKDRNESVMTMVSNTANVSVVVKLLCDNYEEVFNGTGAVPVQAAPPPVSAVKSAPVQPAPAAAAAAPAPVAAAAAPAPAAAAAAPAPAAPMAPPPNFAPPPGYGAPPPTSAPPAYSDIPDIYKKPTAAPAPPPGATPHAEDPRVPELEAKVKQLEAALEEAKAGWEADKKKLADLEVKFAAERKARNWLEKQFEVPLRELRSKHGM
jgi:hypothetical protein